MAITEDIRKVLTDPTPLYAVAGTADLAAEKLKEAPALLEKLKAEAPKRLESVRSTDPKDVQDRVTKQAKEAQDKISELLGVLDTDLRKLTQQAQDLALQGVGRAAEAAVRAQEQYGKLAERGRGAVQSWRGEAAEEVQELAVAIEPDPEPKREPEPKQEPVTEAKTEKTGKAEPTTGEPSQK